jgi:hypothetical protein
MELAVINAGPNTTEEDLFPRALTSLADHYSTLGEREKARDAAGQALLEYTQCSKHNPEVIKALQLILLSNKDED